MQGGKMIYDRSVTSSLIRMFSLPLRLWQEPLYAVHTDDRQWVLDLLQCSRRWEGDHRLQSGDVWWVWTWVQKTDKTDGDSCHQADLILLSCPRVPGASQHPHDYSWGVPLHRVHRSDPAGSVEGAGVGPRPERGGEVWGREVKGKVAVGKSPIKILSAIFWILMEENYL